MQYQLIEHKNSFFEKHWCIQVDEEGPFKGLIYQYDTIKLMETEQGDPEFHFSTVIVENPKGVDTEDPELINGFGQILVELVEQYMKEQDGKDGTADSNESVTR
jgi:hypothetical protein